MDELEQKVLELEAMVMALQRRQLQSGIGTNGDLDNLWMLLGGVLVFFMQAGFALLEVGSVAHKNTKNILVKNVLDAAIGSLCWWAVGYAFAYGPGDTFPKTGENGFAGTQGFFQDLNGRTDVADDEITETIPFKTVSNVILFFFFWDSSRQQLITHASFSRFFFLQHSSFSSFVLSFFLSPDR